MDNVLELLKSPAIVISLAATVAAVLYSYVYLPRRMGRAYRRSLLTLASAVETKDMRAAGHGERVAEYATATARQMRLPKRLIRNIEYAAFLEDVGNIRVPHAILNKPGKLTREEMEQLEAHPAIGQEIVEQVRFLKDIAPYLRHHHEKWDGSGYPDGLMGEQIPLGARILAVATAFDSMTSERPYHAKMDEDAAVAELKAGAGAQFDPAVVEAFLRMLQKRIRTERRAA
ncbi:MAG: HD-GYP domain-containing protein [Armatimonadetes bacterium]|nr:HD-GYP domain-containing protein [Armatimonadota bacterium]